MRPDSVTLRDARSLAELGRLPLGDAAEKRWGAPYLTAHRADLQGALAQAAGAERLIETRYGQAVEAAAISEMPQGVRFDSEDGRHEADLLVGADGVWSAVRQVVRPGASASRFTGALAWRATVGVDSAAAGLLAPFGAARQVVAFLDPNGHLIVYPIAGGRAFNLVAFSPGPAGPAEMDGTRATYRSLLRTLHRSAKALHELIGQAAAVDRLPRPRRRRFGSVDAQWPARADRRRRPRHDPLRGARGGDGHRGRRDPCRRAVVGLGRSARRSPPGSTRDGTACSAWHAAAPSTASSGMPEGPSPGRATRFSRCAHRSGWRRISTGSTAGVPEFAPVRVP